MLKRACLSRASHVRDSFVSRPNHISHHAQQSQATFSIYPGRSGPTHRAFTTSYFRGQDDKSTGVNTRKVHLAHVIQKTTQQPNVLSDEQYTSLTRFENSSLPRGTYTNWVVSILRADRLDGPDRTRTVKLCGYLTARRAGKGFDFLQLVDPTMKHSIQIIVPYRDHENTISSSPVASGDVVWQEWSNNRSDLVRSINAHTPVIVTGTLVRRAKPTKRKEEQENNSTDQEEQTEELLAPVAAEASKTLGFDPYVGSVRLISHVEIQADFIRPLNHFPKDLVAKADTVFPPEQRHLQFRTDEKLRARLQLRSQVAQICRQSLIGLEFSETETPLLFKSTPEGAREFIVPTRKKGMAYALPQSPQQYKQVLMASGVTRYFQFARCFRDEDLRADRQPEFTQLDLEMSFADRHQVMNTVSAVVRDVWRALPSVRPLNKLLRPGKKTDQTDFPVFTYQQVMSRYGSDKPDLRLGSEVTRIDGWLPDSVIAMLSSLKNVAVEMIKVDMEGADVTRSGEFIHALLESPASRPYVNNPAGMPGVAVYDPGKPLRGLASFGHEGAAKVEEHFKPQTGDILIVQVRPNTRFTGGSTPLGNLRRDIYAAAIDQGLINPPVGFVALWVTDFPLFSPVDDSAPGQGGLAGICSTHHPFTAPRPGQDLSKLISDPLDVIGDHYDLVINGVEVGGGSRRIHTADMQELILRDVLQMKPDRIEDFRHLLHALDSGCPPHAGFALGFDRLIAILAGRQSVRDVIAFPKYADGEDKFVGSPSILTQDQLATYHLRTTDTEMEDSRSKIPGEA